MRATEVDLASAGANASIAEVQCLRDAPEQPWTAIRRGYAEGQGDDHPGCRAAGRGNAFLRRGNGIAPHQPRVSDQTFLPRLWVRVSSTLTKCSAGRSSLELGEEERKTPIRDRRDLFARVFQADWRCLREIVGGIETVVAHQGAGQVQFVGRCLSAARCFIPSLLT